MIDLTSIALVGSGPTAIYVLQHIWTHIDVLKNHIDTITVFEKEKFSGMGMPFNPTNTDVYNLANISSEEIPRLQQSFGDWLRKQKANKLQELNIRKLPIDDAAVYSRVALGFYFRDQFLQIVGYLKSAGIVFIEHCESEVIDVSCKRKGELILTDRLLRKYKFSTIVIANGHVWKDEDIKDAAYYATPWPIHKILPRNKEFYNFSVGTLGASLSAFDVVTSLSHRHGEFIYNGGKLKYIKHIEASNFKIVLHSAEGWLPHLQYEQVEPLREIYRHFNRSQILELVSCDGFMRIENYFDKLCRPALIDAFTKDNLLDTVEKLKQENCSFKDLVEFMSKKHEYVNSFEGMKNEMINAKKSVFNKKPTHWMETLDDLMYSLNFHSELLPAEDHLFFHKEIISFLMNVIAALPIESAEILLALYEANSIEIKLGLVSFQDDSFENNGTKVLIQQDNGRVEEIEYKLFINCGGQKKLEIGDYPFQSLVKEGIIRSASAKFANPDDASDVSLESNRDRISYQGSEATLKLSGIDIDSSYRTINSNGFANHFLYDINFTHTNGLRPYSYGLQTCNSTSLIMVESWIAEIAKGKNIGGEIEKITELYEDNIDL